MNYDKEKYRHVYIYSAETVLGYFGFDKVVYGTSRKNGKRKWYEIFKQRCCSKLIQIVYS
jgi:hypothetical protein